MSATTRTSLSSSAQGEASAPRADGSAAPRNAHSLAQTLRASRGVMSTHQRPRSGTSMQRRRRAVRTVREKLAQVRSSALRPTNTALPRSSRKTIRTRPYRATPDPQLWVRAVEHAPDTGTPISPRGANLQHVHWTWSRWATATRRATSTSCPQ